MATSAATTSHLLVTGTDLREVMDFGTLLGGGFRQLTLAASPTPLLRAAIAARDRPLVSVVLWRNGDDEPAAPAPRRLLVISLDGTYPASLPQHGALCLLASDSPPVIQASLALLAADWIEE